MSSAKKSNTKSRPQSISAPAEQAMRNEAVSLNTALLVGGVLGLIFFVYVYLYSRVNPVPIVGSLSMARPTLLAAALVMLVTFVIVFYPSWRGSARGRISRSLTTAVLGLGTAILGTAVLTASVVALAEAFKGAAFDPVTASIMVGVALAAVTYLTIRHARHLTPQRVYSMLAIILFGGILLTAITTQDDLWYTAYLSALGMEAAGPAAKIFNFAFIFSGIMLIALGNILLDKLDGFYRNHPQVGPGRLNLLRWLFIATGLCISGVGLFPFADGTVQGFLHSAAAVLAGAIFAGWMIFLRKIIPIFRPTFYNFSFGTAAAMFGVYLLESLGIYFNITGVELTCFLISTTWLSLLMTNMVQATLYE